MSRTVLLVGGDAPHRRAIRDVLRLEGVAALEAEGAPSALSLLREASFDLVLVADEVRRLALQGLFAQLKRIQPAPMVFLLPMQGSDPAQLRSMAGGSSRLLDPEQSPQSQARVLLHSLETGHPPSDPPPTRSLPPPPDGTETLPSVPPSALPPGYAAPRGSVPASAQIPPGFKPPAPFTAPVMPLSAQPMRSPLPGQVTDPMLSLTPPVTAWALGASAGLSSYARGVVIDRGRALEVVVAQKRGFPAVMLATPSAAMANDREWVTDLVRGATVAARIQHPVLPRIVDVGTADSPYVASEFTPGLTLARINKRLHELEYGFSVEGAASIVVEILGALEAVHDAKLLHGAISPRTIWVTEDGDVQLLQVGIAHLVHATERNMRGSGLIPMTFEYETPESVTDGTVDSKSDLFATGTVGWELIAGERLFMRSDQTSTLDAVRDAVIPPLDAPKAIDACISKLLSRDPDLRPRSAAAARAEMVQAMKEAKTSGPRRSSGTGMIGRLFGKKAPGDVPLKRVESADPRAERAALVKLASR